MIFETYQFQKAQWITDCAYPFDVPDGVREIETDITAWHGCYPDVAWMTQQALGAVLAPFTTEQVQNWCLTTHNDHYPFVRPQVS